MSSGGPSGSAGSSAFVTRSMTRPESSPTKGCSLASTSKSMMPRDQTSADGSGRLPRACSGLMYKGVPTAGVELDVLGRCERSTASPQSTTTTVANPRTMMFAGLRSR